MGMLSPEKMRLKQAWSALVEARRGNGISQQIYDKFAAVHAMPLHNEPECMEIKTYQQFVQHHTRVWYFD